MALGKIHFGPMTIQREAGLLADSINPVSKRDAPYLCSLCERIRRDVAELQAALARVEKMLSEARCSSTEADES